MDQYPTVTLILRHGKHLAVAIAAILPLVALVMVAQGGSVWLLPAGVAIGIIAFGLLMSYVEIICIISDTLLPK